MVKDTSWVWDCYSDGYKMSFEASLWKSSVFVLYMPRHAECTITTVILSVYTPHYIAQWIMHGHVVCLYLQVSSRNINAISHQPPAWHTQCSTHKWFL